MPADGSGIGRPRRLTIMVGELTISDGTTPPPVVGEVGQHTLAFREAPAEDSGAAVTIVHACAEPSNDGSPCGPGMRGARTPKTGPTTWPTTLRGDGWTAQWSATRPVVGQVRLHGRLIDDLDLGVTAGVRARVTRVRVITETIDRADPDRRNWRPVPGGQRLRDVQVSPRWFDDGLVRPPDAPDTGWYAPVPGDPYIRETGVLLDLDIDDVPPLPLRPSIVPGSVDAAGPDVWVADSRLPLLVRVRAPRSDDPEITELGWAGRILEGDHDTRRLHADADGCWIVGPDGVHRAGADGPVRRIDEDPGHLTTAGHGRLLVQMQREPEALVPTLFDPDGTVTDVPLDGSRVDDAVTTPDGFLLLLRHLDHPAEARSGDPGRPAGGRAWLARLAPDGELTAGPYLDLGHPALAGLAGGEHPVVSDQQGEGLRPILEDLTLGGGAPVWRRSLRLYTCGDRMWACAHPPHPSDIEHCGAQAYWPLTGPPQYPEDRQYWLLTELDPATLDPIVSTLVPDVPERVAIDGSGTAWVRAAGEVCLLPPGDGATAQRLDVAALLDRARADHHRRGD